MSCALVHLLHPGCFCGVPQTANYGLHPLDELRRVRPAGSKRFVKALSEELCLRRGRAQGTLFGWSKLLPISQPQNQSQDHSPGTDDVRLLPAITSQGQRFTAIARLRRKPPDGALPVARVRASVYGNAFLEIFVANSHYKKAASRLLKSAMRISSRFLLPVDANGQSPGGPLATVP